MREREATSQGQSYVFVFFNPPAPSVGGAKERLRALRSQNKSFWQLSFCAFSTTITPKAHIPVLHSICYLRF